MNAQTIYGGYEGYDQNAWNALKNLRESMKFYREQPATKPFIEALRTEKKLFKHIINTNRVDEDA